MARKRTLKVSVFDYPEHLNPFREEEEIERIAAQAALEGKTPRCHLLLSSPSGTVRRSPSDCSATSSGLSTPVNGTLRRRMKRRAPLPPAVPLTSPQSQQDVISPTEPSHQVAEIISEEKLDSCKKEEDASSNVPIVTEESLENNLPSRVDSQCEKESYKEEDKERLNTEIGNSEIIEPTISPDLNETILINDSSPSKEMPLNETEQVDTKDKTTEQVQDVELVSPKEQEDQIESVEMVKDVTSCLPTELDNNADDTPCDINEETTTPLDTLGTTDSKQDKAVEDTSQNIKEEQTGTCIDEKLIENFVSECKIEETIVKENLKYIDQDDNDVTTTTTNTTTYLNGHSKQNESNELAPKSYTNKFSTQVSKVEIRISDVAEV